jgi:hypothetical protein
MGIGRADVMWFCVIKLSSSGLCNVYTPRTDIQAWLNCDDGELGARSRSSRNALHCRFASPCKLRPPCRDYISFFVNYRIIPPGVN